MHSQTPFVSNCFQHYHDTVAGFSLCFFVSSPLLSSLLLLLLKPNGGGFSFSIQRQYGCHLLCVGFEAFIIIQDRWWWCIVARSFQHELLPLYSYTHTQWECGQIYTKRAVAVFFNMAVVIEFVFSFCCSFVSFRGCLPKKHFYIIVAVAILTGAAASGRLL